MGNITRRTFLGAAGLMVASLSGCGSTKKLGNGADGRVYWLNFKPELDGLLQMLAHDYSERTGVPVKIKTASSGSYYQERSKELASSEPPTLFVVSNVDDALRLSDSVVNLEGTSIAAQSSTTDFNLYGKGKKLVALGYCYECFGIVANIGHIEKAGHSASDIRDFSSLKTIAEDIHARAAELGFDAFVATDLDDDSSWRVTAHLANLEYYYEERDEGGWGKCPPQIKGTYLDNYRALYDLAVNNSLVEPVDCVAGGHDPVTQFKRGDATFFLTGSWDFSNIFDEQKRVGMFPYYCGVAGEEMAGLNCGTENYWAVNANVSADDQQATIDFMTWLVTDPEASAALVEQLGIMPFVDAAQSTNWFLGDAESYSEQGCYIMDWATSLQPNSDAYRAALVDALVAYNKEQTDERWADVRTAFVDGWATQYANRA